MTECHDGAIRDLLPDFAADRLTEAEGERVRAHLAGCRACAAEWRIVTELRQLRVPAPAVDPARIAAAVRRAHPRQVPPAAVPVSHRAVHRAAGLLAGPRWRLVAARAAAVMLLVAGASTVLRETVQRTDHPAGSALAISAGGETDTGLLALAGGSAGVRVSVSYGDLGEYSAEELAVVMERLDQWDGEPSAEPMGTIPLLPEGAR